MTTNKDCLIYMRTSTLTNKDGDSKHRQKSSIMKWLKDNGYTSKQLASRQTSKDRDPCIMVHGTTKPFPK